MNKYYIVFKGGKELFVCAKNVKDAITEAKKQCPSKEVVGYYER